MTSPIPRPAPSGPAVTRSRSAAAVVIDAIVGVVLWVALVLGGGLAMFYAVMYFATSVDGCIGGKPCAGRDRAEFAVLVVCAGVVGSWTVAGIGTVTCAILRRYIWYWPLIGIATASAFTWWGVRMAIEAGGL